MVSEDLSITLYTKKGILTGSISLLRGSRLLDLLNEGFKGDRSKEGAFLKLSDVTIIDEEGRKERYNAIYIAKSNLLMVATPDADTARGICAKLDLKSPPFVQKSSTSIRLELQDYSLTGNIHCGKGEMVLDVLNTKLAFLPITDAKIRAKQTDHWLPVAFLAVNSKEVFSAYEIIST